MKKINKKVFLSLLTTIVTLVTILSFGLICSYIIHDDTKAAGVQLTVKKNETVSIYVHGEYVTLLSSSETEDVYLIKEATSVKLRAVNEARIFTGWVGLPAAVGTAKGNSTVEFDMPSDSLVIDCTRRDPNSEDFGAYMNNRFIISDAKDILAIANILNDTATKADFDLMFNGYASYPTLNINTAADKEKLKEMLLNGHFLVENNISLLEDNFTGIKDFKGVLCGNNNGQHSTVITAISIEEQNGTNYYGLFKELSKEALIRNLEIDTSIGIKETANTLSDNGMIYAGGLAGRANDPIISDVKISTKMGIFSTKATVYAGGIAGVLRGGISAHENVIMDYSNATWNISSKSNADQIYVGLLAGSNYSVVINENTFDNVYCHHIEIDAANTSVTINNNNSIYFGLLLGRLAASNDCSFDNIRFISDGNSTFHSQIDNEDSYMGGMIGYVDATSPVYIGYVRFYGSHENNTTFLNQTLNSSSKANLYTGGLFGYIVGSNLIATDAFKNSINTIVVDGKPYVEGDYLFDGNYLLRSVNKGTNFDKDTDEANTSYGKVITAGVAAYGYFDINGTEGDQSQLLIHCGHGNMTIESIQNSESSNTGNDLEHCIASLVFGLYTKDYFATSIEYIDIFSSNTTVNAERSKNSDGLGDLRAAGFLGYANGTPFKNINLRFNDIKIFVNSLSYDNKFDPPGDQTKYDANNVYCGGFIAELENSNYTNTDTDNSLQNITLEGYDSVNYTSKGATFEFNSIQNNTPGEDDCNYLTENYCGGLIGQVDRYENISNIKIIGESKETAQIIMQSHRDPDSAFCGGIIGFIKKEENYAFILSDVEVKSVSILGMATNTNSLYDNPDIFVGGIIGATYFDDSSDSNTMTNILVYNCDVKAISNNLLRAYSGGITGTVRWNNSQTVTLTNCYVESSNISSKADSNAYAYAAGIIADINSGTCNLYGCIVNNSTVDCNTLNSSNRAAGIVANGNGTFSNCYANVQVYGVANAISTANRTSNNSYYLSNATSQFGTEINLAPFAASKSGTTFKVFSDDGNTTFDTWKNCYPIIKDTTYFSLNAYSADGYPTVTFTGTASTPAATLVEIWYSSNHNIAESNTPDSYSSDYERNKNGWFKVGETIVYNGTLSSSTDIDSYDITFTDGMYSYLYSNTDLSGNRFLTNKTDDSVLIKSGYIHDKTDSTLLDTYTILDSLNIKVFDGIEDIVIKFTIGKNVPLLVPTLFKLDDDNKVTIIDKNPEMNDNYGTYTMTNKVVGENREYTIVYKPNPNMENLVITKDKDKDVSDLVFYLGFEIGSTETYSKKLIKIDLIANELVFEKIITAPYTPSINESTQSIVSNDVTYQIGKKEYPYLLDNNSTYKFIPVFSKSNDIEDILYDSDTNIQYVTYQLGTGAGTYVDMGKNGEMKTKAVTGNTAYSLTVTSQDGNSKEIYFKVVTAGDVSFNIIGYDYDGLNNCISDTDYILNLSQYANYHTIPNTFKVTANSVDITEKITVLSGDKIIYDWTNNITSWNWANNNGSLRIIVPSKYIDGNLSFQIEFPQVYIIKLHLNNTAFYPGCPVEEIKEFRVVAGTKLSSVFTADVMESIDDWTGINHTETTPAGTDAYLFGYLFNGFFLVDDANSLNSYGLSFEDYISTYYATCSIDFYGRWCFLIEIIEAPGTHIVTSFAASFMQTVTPTDYPGLIASGRVVSVPINANKGYVFTIEKDDDFVGEAAVEAFSVQLDGSGKAITNSITIERYHDNAYLYFVPPSSITGYLVIASSVSNSDFIVGENEAAMNESIIPEDGVYTFKYIVNHRKGDASSYIYDNDNLDEKRNMLITFKEQVLNVTRQDGQVINTLEYVSREVPVGTTIEIYYHSYVEGVHNSTIVGTYTVEDTPISSLTLDQFTLLNLSGQAFNTNQTFRDYLGSANSFSEVYYISITPPNGYSEKVQNKVFNYEVEVGYIDSSNNYLVGERTSNDFANLPLDRDEINLPEYILQESSYQRFLYSITPSRDTELSFDEENEIYHFKDYKYFNIYNVKVSFGELSTEFEDHFINLHGTIGQRGRLMSGDEGVGFIINSLSITAGYNLGTLNVYGKNKDDAEWGDPIGVIEIDDIQYKTYVFDFTEYDYDCFAVVNLSGEDIHVKDLAVTDRANGIPYTISFNDFETNLTEYSINMDIVNDVRHESKKFIMAVQLSYEGQLATDIPSGVKLLVGTNEYKSLNDEYKGRNTLFFNLSDILVEEGVSEIEYTLDIPSDYSLVSALLYESYSSIKPAMGEVRWQYSKGAVVNYNFVYMGGCVTSGSLVNNNSSLIISTTTLQDPTDGDLVFGGWYEDAALTKPINQLLPTDGSKTLYGVFYPAGSTLKTVTLSYLINGDTETTISYKVAEGFEFTLPQINEIDKTGYEFDKWDKGAVGDVITIEDDITISALYQVKQYTITINPDNGSPVIEITQDYGTPITAKLPTALEKPGYTFTGQWSGALPGSMPADNIEIIAIWEANTYTITFYDELSHVYVTDDIKYLGAIHPPVSPTKAGYKFIGWDLLVDGIGDGSIDEVYSYMEIGGLEYVAIWEQVHTMTFIVDGNTYHTITDVANADIVLPDVPTKPGYTFIGWAPSVPNEMPEKDGEYFAQWSGNIVLFNPNGGNVGITSIKYEGVELELPIPTRTNHIFMGWSTDLNGENIVNSPYVPIEDNITLYAQWRGYIVTYNANGGNVTPASATYEGEALILPEPTRSGYAFDGWYTAGNGGTRIGSAGAEYTPTGDIEIFARWQKLYKITFTSSGNNWYTYEVETVTYIYNSVTYETSESEIYLPEGAKIIITGATYRVYYNSGSFTYVNSGSNNSTRKRINTNPEYTINSDITLTFTT